MLLTICCVLLWLWFVRSVPLQAYDEVDSDEDLLALTLSQVKPSHTITLLTRSRSPLTFTVPILSNHQPFHTVPQSCPHSPSSLTAPTVHRCGPHDNWGGGEASVSLGHSRQTVHWRTMNGQPDRAHNAADNFSRRHFNVHRW